MPAETKRERFERIAQRRANETIKALRLLGNLSDKRNYDYSEKHVDTLLGAIDLEVRALKGRFRKESGASDKPFRFK